LEVRGVDVGLDDRGLGVMGVLGDRRLGSGED
jgi:hypothetical protein